MKRTALVTGAAGAIGPALVDHLLSVGYHVHALIRKSSDKKIFSGAVEVFTGDINDRGILENACRGVRVIFHLAAKLHINQPDPSLDDEYYLVNVEGTRSLVSVATAAGVDRIVFFSTISVYGSQSEKDVAFETTFPNPQSIYARSKLQAEDIILKATQHDDSSVKTGVVLRLAAVYGPHMKGNYCKMMAAIKQGWFLPVGRGDNFRTLIFEKDVVKAAIFAAACQNVAGKIYNITDGRIHALNDIYHHIYGSFGKRQPAVHIPVKPIFFLARVIDIILNIVLKRILFAPMVEKLVENVAVNGDKFQEETGFKPEYDLKKGWQQTIINFFE